MIYQNFKISFFNLLTENHVYWKVDWSIPGSVIPYFRTASDNHLEWYPSSTHLALRLVLFSLFLMLIMHLFASNCTFSR